MPDPTMMRTYTRLAAQAEAILADLLAHRSGQGDRDHARYLITHLREMRAKARAEWHAILASKGALPEQVGQQLAA